MTTHDTPEAAHQHDPVTRAGIPATNAWCSICGFFPLPLAHRPKVRNADLAAWEMCLVCGEPARWVSTGWEPRPPDGEIVGTGYWRHARKAKP
jgi:hypothetical protein